jgi:rhamnose utilization protein RhaD (predicted bifunctional aldolase and dehydrogenase)
MIEMYTKGTVIPLATTSEFFNKNLHTVLHAGGNTWVKGMWDKTKDGGVFDYYTSQGSNTLVKLIKRENISAWEIG